MANVMATTDRSIISLFSGAMGLDLGLEAAGYRTAVVLEKNSGAVQTIRLNRDDSLPVLAAPIDKVSTYKLLSAAGLAPSEAFVLTGGPCCQTFSTAGTRSSLGDRRGLLFRHFKRIVRGTRPRFFVMENVKGMLSAAIRHRPLDERGPGFPPLAPDEEFGSALKVICRELAKLNYYVIFGLLNCADYGVPQTRYRVVFIGSRDGENIELPRPSHTRQSGNGMPSWVTLEQAIGDLRETDPEFLPFSQDRLMLLKRLKSGENWRDLPKRLQRKALGAAADSWGGRSGFCRRLDWHKPSPTITTAPDGRATTLCHPSELRPLSVRECARLQQFPDDWRFAGTTGMKYVQIGNAVPIGLGKAIGKMLRRTARRTDEIGRPKEAVSRLGKVVCADPGLEVRLKQRPKTQLHPPRLRKNSDSMAARKWLASVRS